MRNLVSFENRFPSDPLDLFTDLDSFFAPFWGQTPMKSRRSFLPQTTAEETPEYFLIQMDVPGIPQEKVTLEVKDQNLIIRGERNDERKEAKGRTLIEERNFGQFERVFRIPTETDIEHIEAQHTDGVLKIIIPKLKKSEPKAIPISTSKKSGLFDKLLNKSSAES